MAEATENIIIDAPRSLVYEVITDYDAYPAILPTMEQVKILESKDNEWVVQFQLNLIKLVSYTLKLKGKPGKRLDWTLVEGDGMKKNSGYWKLSSKAGKTHVEYAISLDFIFSVPRFIANRLVRSSLPETLNAFKQEAEKRRGAGQ